jgi:hypothetical protein
VAFDQTTRNRLNNFVGAARALLTEEFARQLQSDYGLDPGSGRMDDVSAITHLDDRQRETAHISRDTVHHYTGGKSDRKACMAAIDRILREQAFTVLNRLAALRMMEARGLLLPSVAEGARSDGFQLYQQLAGVALGETDAAYEAYLFSLFDEFAVDLPVLFDRFSPQGRLFPGGRALRQLLELLNDSEIGPLWAEDETIGWIYQYFNSKEERQAMRKASGAPRNSRELAVRNQFFTPRYVVEFLTDNTLGRIWYEMTQGKTRLVEDCRYLVRRPNEVFLGPGEAAPGPEPADDLTQEELLKQTVCIPHRPLKDPREIKMLDPACGSMHFGLYAFDVFETIYKEAWEMSVLGAWAKAYEDKAAFMRDVPRLIIEHNIHGIDIDPRAVQIAGLSLWLRAQRSWQVQGVAAADRPPVTRSNIVTAEPMPGDEAELEAFLAAQFGDTVQDQIVAGLVRRVFEAMKLAGEAGSLLKIEEEIADDIAAAREEWTTPPKARQSSLFERPQQAALTVDTQPISNEQFWEQVEERIYDALEEFAEQSVKGEGYRRLLFAQDAVRGFAFIDLCRQKYDVVLMNPPFGAPSKQTKSRVTSLYPDSKNDIYACFVQRGAEQLHQGAMLGAITSRTGFFLSSLELWRRNVLLNMFTPSIVLDLGQGVLDSAMVETAAYVLTRSERVSSDAIFVRLIDKENKKKALLRSLTYGKQNNIYLANSDSFKDIPNLPFAYWVSNKFRQFFARLSKFESDGRTVRVGLQTADDFRFVRAWWEVDASLQVSGNTNKTRQQFIDQTQKGYKWVPFAKGGAYAPYYSDLHLVLNWQMNGAELKCWAVTNPNDPSTTHYSRNIRSEDCYFLPGLTYPRRVHRLPVSPLPSGAIISVRSTTILATKDDLKSICGLGNSQLFDYLFKMLLGRTDFPEFTVGVLQQLPVPEWNNVRRSDLGRLALEISEDLQLFDTGDENSHAFRCPVGLTEGQISLKNSYSAWVSQVSRINDRIATRQTAIDELVANLYGVTLEDKAQIFKTSSEAPTFELPPLVEIAINHTSFLLGVVMGRWDIRYITSEKEPPPLHDPFDPLPVCPPGMLQSTDGLPAAPEDVPADYPLHISWSGILVDDDGHPEDIVGRVREALHVIWGDKADAIEAEACALLGVDSLRHYFSNPNNFFADHLSRYSKSRRAAPIYWPLTSGGGNYTLWFYYHRLHDGSLYQCVNDFVDPKLAAVQRQLGSLRGRSRSRDDERELARLTDLAAELETFRKDLLQLAAFWRPNLNDGVEISAAPLYALFANRKWRDRLQETWQKLQEGEYDWAHLAMNIWPSRVAPKCVADRSLAIAHDIEKLFWVEENGTWRPIGAPAEEEARQIEGRQSAERERLRDLLAALAAGEEGYLPAMQTWQSLAEGAWDHRPLGLHLFPERATEAAFDNASRVLPHLTGRGQKLLQKDTKKNKRLLTKRLLARGTPELVGAVEATLAEEPMDFATLWQGLEQGEWDERPLALELWPARVVGKALKDAKLAAQHGLFDFFWYDEPGAGVRRRQPIQREITHEVERRGGDCL